MNNTLTNGMHTLDDPFILLYIATILEDAEVLHNCLMVFRKLRKYIKDHDLQVQLWDYMTKYTITYETIYGTLPNGSKNGWYKKERLYDDDVIYGKYINNQKEGVWIVETKRFLLNIVEYTTYENGYKKKYEKYINDDLREQTIYEGDDYIDEIYDNNGQLIVYSDSKIDAPLYKWHSDGKLWKCIYCTGVYNLEYSWHCEGYLWSSKYELKNGSESLEYHWNQNGELKKYINIINF